MQVLYGHHNIIYIQILLKECKINFYLPLLSFKAVIPRETYHINDMLKRLNLLTLHKRRICLDLCFTFNLLTSNIDSEYLLSKINIHWPPRPLRNHDLFFQVFMAQAMINNPPSTYLRTLNLSKNNVDVNS